jgi:hypothetical protein
VRRVTSGVFALPASAVLLLGCNGTEPLEPTAAGAPMGAVVTGTQVAAPSNVTVVATSDVTVRVTWQDNTIDETHFEVYRATYPTGIPTQSGILARTAENVTTYLDAGLSPNWNYCYQVVAVRQKDTNAIRSSPSPTVCALTPPPAPTAARETVAVPSSSHGVTVYWSYASMSFDQNSRIDRSTNGGAVWEIAGTVHGSGYFYDDGLPSERPVCYRVVNYTAAGVADPSNTACTTPPAVPTAVTARQVDAQVFELTWSDNSAVEGGYEVRAHYRYCSYYYFIGEVCDEYDEVLAVLPANWTRHRVAGVVDAEYAGRITVYAMKDGGYSDPASASYVTGP